MQLFIRANKTHNLEVNKESKISELKTLCHQNLGLNNINLTYDGKLLEDENTKIRELGIKEFSTIEASIAILGGGKKRKKKVYTTQKRIPRKHVSIKLRVLQLYKVDDDGKVQRLKKQCPNCRHGTFMATHYDRTACGRCTLTYKYTNE